MSTETKPSTKRQQWPRIRRVNHNNGTLAWLVDGRIAGKGERFFFKSKGEADTKSEQLRTERKNNGTEAMAIPAKLRVEALDCARQLAAVGASLADATAYYLRHAKPKAGAKTVQDVIAALLRAKEQAGRRPVYLRILGNVLGYFAKTFGEREIHTLNHGEIADWMAAQPWVLRTRENYRCALSGLISFAVKHGHCATNPIEKLERATLDDKPPGIVTVKQAADLLNAAEQTENGQLLPYVAIGLFAGLRASELASLDWSEISIAERTIEVLARKSKTRARRIVTMPDNLAAWLTPYAHTEGSVAPFEGALKNVWKRVRDAAGIDPWPTNAMRHSFASYHVAAHRNAPQTSLEMGHDNPHQLFASYRELVKPTAAQGYWELRPNASVKLISLAAA